MTVPQDHLKCVVTLTGDSISHAVSFQNDHQVKQCDTFRHFSIFNQKTKVIGFLDLFLGH